MAEEKPNVKGEDLLAEAMSAGLPSSHAHEVLKAFGHDGLRKRIEQHKAALASRAAESGQTSSSDKEDRPAGAGAQYEPPAVMDHT